MNKSRPKNGGKVSKSSSEGYGHSGTGFISFSDVTSSSSSSFTSNAPSSAQEEDVGLTPIYRGSDPELAMSCKRMVKKDITTKLKSFNEVILLLQERSHLIHEFLPYFTYIFPRMFMDNDRKIREQLFVLLMTIVSLDKQTLTPYMKHLIGHWYIGTVDPCIEVRAMALSSLEKAIPPRKREPVLLYLSTSLLRQIRYFLDQKPETLSDMSHTSQEDAMERYERIYISTIASISKLTSFLSCEGNQQLLDIDIDTSDRAERKSMLGYSLVLTSGVYKKLTSKKANFRKCTLELVISVINALGPHIEKQDHGDGKSQLIDIHAVFRNLLVLLGNEHDESILSLTIDALLVTSRYKQFLMQLWSTIDIDKQLLQPLLSQVKAFPEVLLPPLLTIIGGVIPSEFTSIYSKFKAPTNGVDSDEFMVHDLVSDFVNSIALLTEDDAFSSNRTNVSKVDVFVAEASLVLLLRKSVDSDAVLIQDDDDEIYIKRKAILSQRLVNSVVLALDGLAKHDHTLDVVNTLLQAMDKVLIQIARASLPSSSPSSMSPTSLWLSLVDKVCERLSDPSTSPDTISSLLKITEMHDQLRTCTKERLHTTCITTLKAIKTFVTEDDIKVCSNMRAILDILVESNHHFEQTCEKDQFATAIADCLLSIWCVHIRSGASKDCVTLYHLIPLHLLDTDKIYQCLHTVLTISFEVGCFFSVYEAMGSFVSVSVGVNTVDLCVKLCSDVFVSSIGDLLQWIDQSAKILINTECKSQISLPAFKSPIDFSYAVGCLFIFLQISCCKDKYIEAILQRVHTSNMNGSNGGDNEGTRCADGNSGIYMTKVSRFALLSCLHKDNCVNGISEAVIVDMLISVFFNRHRKHYKLQTGDQNSIKLILSWTCVCKHLLPSCATSTVRRRLGDALVYQLRESLLSSSQSSTVPSIQPKKLARQICAVRSIFEATLIDLTDSKGAPDFLYLYDRVGLLDMGVLEGFISSERRGEDEAIVERVIDCLVQVAHIWRNDGANDTDTSEIADNDDDASGDSGDDDELEGEAHHDVHLHAQMPELREDTLPLYHTLYHLCDTITTTSPSVNTSRALLKNYILKCLSALSPSSRHLIARLLLTRVQGRSYEVYRSTTSMLAALYRSMYATDNCDQSLMKPLDIRFCSIREVELGTTLYYLSERNRNKIAAKEARLIAVDKQAGEAPFYTIKIHDSEIERQTEEGNLFSIHVDSARNTGNMPLVLEDTVEYTDLKDLVEESDDTQYLWSFLYGVFSQQSVDDDYGHSGNAEVRNIENDVQLALFLVKTVLPTLDRDLAPILRGLCIGLIEGGSLNLGVSLLESLSSTRWGRGCGVWILPPMKTLLAKCLSSSSPIMLPADQSISLCDMYCGGFDCTLLIELLERLTMSMCQLDIKDVDVRTRIAVMKCHHQLFKAGSQYAKDVCPKVLGMALDELCRRDGDSKYAKAVAILLLHTLIGHVDVHQVNSNTIGRSNMTVELKCREAQLLECMMDTTILVESRLAAAKSLECLYGLEECLQPLVVEAMDMVSAFGEDEEDEDNQMEKEIGKQIAIRVITGSLFSLLSKGLLLQNTSQGKEKIGGTKEGKDEQCERSPSIDRLAIIFALNLALKKIDMINLQTQIMPSCPERLQLSTAKGLTASYIKSSGMLDSAMKLLFKAGALMYSQSSSSSSPASSRPPSPKKNTHKFNALDLHDTISVDKKGVLQIYESAVTPSLSSAAILDGEYPASAITHDESDLGGLAAGCMRKIISILPSYIRSWWLEDAPEVKVTFLSPSLVT